MKIIQAVKLTHARGEGLTPAQQEILTRLLKHHLLIYHLEVGDTYHYARKGKDGIDKWGTKVHRRDVKRLISGGYLSLQERGTIQEKYPYGLYAVSWHGKGPGDDLPPHMGYTYITLPSGASLGYCQVCGVWHLPGDFCAVLTLEELLEYFYLGWKAEKDDLSPLQYLATKPGKPARHQG